MSAEGSYHAASRTILATYSPWFENMTSMPPPDANLGSQTELIELGNTSTAGLALVLSVLGVHHAVIQASKADLNPSTDTKAQSLPTPFRMPTRSVIIEADKIADMYDISAFDSTFSYALIDHPDHSPALAFALAAVLLPNNEARHTLHAARILQSSITSFPPDIHYILSTYAPLHLIRFNGLASRSIVATEALGKKLVMAGEDRKGSIGYSEKCMIGIGRKGRWKCSARLSGLRWKNLMAGAIELASAEVPILGGLEQRIGLEAVVVMLRRIVPCPKCARRIAHLFLPAIKEYREVTYGYA